MLRFAFFISNSLCCCCSSTHRTHHSTHNDQSDLSPLSSNQSQLSVSSDARRMCALCLCLRCVVERTKINLSFVNIVTLGCSVNTNPCATTISAAKYQGAKMSDYFQGNNNLQGIQRCNAHVNYVNFQRYKVALTPRGCQEV